MRETRERIDRHNLVERLRSAFPEIEDELQKELRERVDERTLGNYAVFGSVLAPYVRQELATGHLTDFLRRFADFMEGICISGDVEAVNVLWLEIFRPLFEDRQAFRILRPVLGSKTKAQIKDAARRWQHTWTLIRAGWIWPF